MYYFNTFSALAYVCYNTHMNFFQELGLPPSVVFFILVWSLFWKGLALWHAATVCKQRNWFIVLLVVSSMGILEILYLFVFAQKKFSFRKKV